jgi:spore coat polysaccharide biosynthesis protein SpsF
VSPSLRQAPVAIVQARSSSRRLPDKVLLELAGKPMLAYTVERLRRSRAVRDVVLATSDRADDDRVAALGERLGVDVMRGALDDVLGRFLAAAKAAGADAVVRISGDSPLIDPQLVDRVVARFAADACDLATNVFPRSFPKGQSVEVVTMNALERAARETADPEDREHVTRFFYRNADRFEIRNVASPRDLSHVQLSVDTPEDLALVRGIFAAMDRPHWEYGLDEILALREAALVDRTIKADH